MYLKLKPYDYALFRDGRPFSAGSEHYARSIFPPFGSTVFHALRTALLDEKGFDFSVPSLLSEDNITVAIGGVALRGLWIENGKPYLPAPADLRYDKKKKIYSILPLIKLPVGSLSTGFTAMTVLRDSELESVNDCWIHQDDYGRYLASNLAFKEKVVSRADVIVREPRTGVELKADTRSAEDGKLYMVDGVALKEKWHLEVWGNFPDTIKQVKWLTLGGERRTFSCETASDTLNLPSAKVIADVVAGTGMFKLILLTPAWFKNGWRPSWINDDYSGECAGVKIRLLTALCGRSLKCGGWDLVHQRPKPMVNLAPAGSVYYVAIDNSSPDKVNAVVNALHLQNISDEEKRFGFGLAAIGGVNYV